MSIFPFIDSQTANPSSVEALPLFQEWAYDFDKNTLLLKDGTPHLISGNEALKVWVFKALRTPRFIHYAHSFSFGNEIDTIIGSVSDEGILQSEIRRFIIEALMVNPYIEELKNFAFTRAGSILTVEFEVHTIYGMMNDLLIIGGAA